MYKIILHDCEGEKEFSFTDSVVLEEQYFKFSRFRFPCSESFLKLISYNTDEVPIGMFYLNDDATTDYEREKFKPRKGLWPDRGNLYMPPTPYQLRAIGKIIGSGSDIERTARIESRLWRRLAGGEQKPSFATWRLLLELAGIAERVMSVEEEKKKEQL